MSGSKDRGAALSRALGAAALSLAVTGCFTGTDGREPNPGQIYFPTALEASPGGTTLYVANSDFDLAFSGGTVLALDLTSLRSLGDTIASSLGTGASLAEACAQLGLLPNGDTWLEPGPCTPLPVGPFVGASVNIGAFASGMTLTHAPDTAQSRLFVTVRGDPSVTYFDVPDDREGPAGFALSCGAGADGFCDASHRLGQDPDKSLRGVQLPADPIGIAASEDGTVLVTAHQTQASASLVLNDWAGRPELSFVRTGLSAGPTELATLPRPAFVEGAAAVAEAAGFTFQYGDGFLLTFRASAELDILRFTADEGAVPPRPFLVRDRAFAVSVNASNFDSRGVAVVDGPRRACEATCGGEQACLEACAESIPVTVFLANRSPAALLVGQVNTTVIRANGVAVGAVDDILFYDSIPLSFGPTRVEVGQVVGPDGELVDRVFVVCFDSRRIFVIDPVLLREETVVQTGRGPQDVAFDTGTADGEPHSYLYVGHFTDSYLSIVDLDRRRPATYGQVLVNVGDPTPPIETR